MRVRKTRVHIQNVSVIWYIYIYMYTCEYMHVYQEVLSVSTRKGINICEFAKHGFIYERICNMICMYIYIYVYLWAYACIQRGSNCEPSQGQRNMWVCKTLVHIQSHLWYNICILVSFCMHPKSFKVSALARAQTYGNSHNKGSETKTIHHKIHVY